jgi:hypothetical protein
MKSSLKKLFLWVALGIFTFLYVSPLQAQDVRDHRTKNTETKVRDHRTKKTDDKVRDHRENKAASTVSFFEEEGAFFGTRTQILEKYPSFKTTGKVNTIMITEKLHDGDNLIYKMESGNALHAIVKKGKIIKYTWKDSRGNQISGGSGDDVIRGGAGDDQIVEKAQSPTCYKCTKVCHDPDKGDLGTHPDGGPNCWTTCVVVDCSDEHTHTLPGPVVGKTKK